MNWYDILALAAALGLPKRKRNKQMAIKDILAAQERIGAIDERVEPFCEMCGRHVIMREAAHIVAEAGNARVNVLQLCPSCHRIFDRHLKRRLYMALKAYKVKGISKSWETPFGIGRMK